MSAFQSESQDAWKEAFFDKQDRTTPGNDQQPGWHLTAVGVTLGLVALLMLSV